MKDNDQKEFEEWQSQFPLNYLYTVEDSWSACAKLKNKRIEELDIKYTEDIVYLDKKIEQLEADLKEVASLILTSGYTVNDKGERVMDGNEFIWIDAAVHILKKYHKRK